MILAIVMCDMLATARVILNVEINCALYKYIFSWPGINMLSFYMIDCLVEYKSMSYVVCVPQDALS